MSQVFFLVEIYNRCSAISVVVPAVVVRMVVIGKQVKPQCGHLRKTDKVVEGCRIGFVEDIALHGQALLKA